MTAEPIARVIADLRHGRVRNLPSVDDDLHATALAHAQDVTVIDATAIYESLVAKDEPVYLYEDHPCIAPPFERAAVCYVNEHGNVIVMQATATEHPKPKRRQRWQPASYVDWDRVRWTTDAFVWIGGRSPAAGGPIPTTGPVHLWQFAITEDGSPADLHWVRLVPEVAHPLEDWDMAHLVLLGSLNFLACRNVELVEPARQRGERRRLARTGVKVHTISVFPVGRWVRSAKAEGGGGVPLTSVRGHFAMYGPEYGRGLLFGKLSGRFWIPQHARGSAEHGRSEADYRLVPNQDGAA